MTLPRSASLTPPLLHPPTPLPRPVPLGEGHAQEGASGGPSNWQPDQEADRDFESMVAEPSIDDEDSDVDSDYMY